MIAALSRAVRDRFKRREMVPHASAEFVVDLVWREYLRQRDEWRRVRAQRDRLRDVVLAVRDGASAEEVASLIAALERDDLRTPSYHR